MAVLIEIGNLFSMPGDDEGNDADCDMQMMDPYE